MGNFLENVMRLGSVAASATGARRCPSGAATEGHVHVVGSVEELQRAWP